MMGVHMFGKAFVIMTQHIMYLMFLFVFIEANLWKRIKDMWEKKGVDYIIF